MAGRGDHHSWAIQPTGIQALPSSSSSSSHAYHVHHGLENKFGHNNCFLNVCIQTLWQIEAFREAIMDWKHVEPNFPEQCVVCRLRDIFREFERSNSFIICPSELRQALAVAFLEQNRFQLRDMADAAETYVAMLDLIHKAAYPPPPEELKGSGLSPERSTYCNSPVRQYLTLVTDLKIQCDCGEETILPESTTLAPISVVELLSPSSELDPGQHGEQSQASFEKIFKRLFRPTSVLNCRDEKCKLPETHRSVTKILRSSPVNLAINLAWPVTSARAESVFDVFGKITDSLHINACFDETPQGLTESGEYEFILTAMTCFYGNHYVTFVLGSDNVWRYFDDSLVRTIGAWQDVIVKCIQSRFQPIMLHYQRRFKHYQSGLARPVRPAPAPPHTASSVPRDSSSQPHAYGTRNHGQTTQDLYSEQQSSHSIPRQHERTGRSSAQRQDRIGPHRYDGSARPPAELQPDLQQRGAYGSSYGQTLSRIVSRRSNASASGVSARPPISASATSGSASGTGSRRLSSRPSRNDRHNRTVGSNGISSGRSLEEKQVAGDINEALFTPMS